MSRFDEIETLNAFSRKLKVQEQKDNQDKQMAERQRKLDEERQEEAEREQQVLQSLNEKSRLEHALIVQERIKDREK